VTFLFGSELDVLPPALHPPSVRAATLAMAMELSRSLAFRVILRGRKLGCVAIVGILS
jgi:hypothetical protein